MSTTYNALKLEQQLCFPLYAASREIIKQYHPYLEALDLTYTQYITMLVFWEHRTISAKELGKKLFLDSGTLTPVLKSLEAKGLITRRRSTEDERVLMTELTEKGEALKEKAVGIPEAVSAGLSLTPAQYEELHKLLYTFLENFR